MAFNCVWMGERGRGRVGVIGMEGKGAWLSDRVGLARDLFLGLRLIACLRHGAFFLCGKS